MIKTLLKKAGEKDFSEDEEMTTKRDLDKIVFLAKAFSVKKTSFYKQKGKSIFPTSSKNSVFFFTCVLKKKKREMLKELFFGEISNDRNLEIKFLEG